MVYFFYKSYISKGRLAIIRLTTRYRHDRCPGQRTDAPRRREAILGTMVLPRPVDLIHICEGRRRGDCCQRDSVSVAGYTLQIVWSLATWRASDKIDKVVFPVPRPF
jgi:hypothetical protein